MQSEGMKATCIEPARGGQETALAVIEYRIATHMNGAYENIIEVGRCLCEAKEAGLVPHGQWEAWVRQNTGMSERSAQKLMQTARSIHSGSSLAKLPISKITTILRLPEPEREGMAERAISEEMSLRQLQEAVRREKQRADQLAAEKAEAERELNTLKADTATLAETLAESITDERLAEAEEEIEALRKAIAAAQEDGDGEEAKRLRAQLEITKAFANRVRQRAEKANKQGGISPEAQAEIDRLSGELAEAERYAEEQAELRQQAQQELLNQRMQRARGEQAPIAAFGSAQLATAVQAFIAAAGIFPHTGSSIRRASDGERAQMRQYIDMIDEWVTGARRALAQPIASGEGR